MEVASRPRAPATGRALASALALALTLALPAAGCASIGSGFNLISLDEEWELGRQLEADLAGKLDLVDDPAALAYLRDAGGRIVAETPLAGREWRFHLVRDPTVNAFNLPGGLVYVHTGLIAAADDASEFAGVLAHEIAHGAARHGTQQLSQRYGLAALASLVLGQDPGMLESIAAQIAAGGALARFSRAHEREADELGLGYMHAAGYDPDGMPGMFEDLLAARRRRPGSVEQFFSSHPLTEERIEATRRLAAALPQPPTLVRDEPGFRELKRRYRDEGRAAR